MRFADRYSPVERALHYLAFSVPFVQKALGELENDLFARERARSSSGREVFITGLPRAGTTLLLELLYRTGEFCSFTYRHMPFVLAPLIFGRASRANARGKEIERAHGDGMQVSLDSPEAFEEVLWLTYLREHIVAQRTLEPLTADKVSVEFEDAFRATIQKLLADSRSGGCGARYLSKNNANISRLGVLSEMFPDSTIIVAFREPSAHIASLMRQHRRFSTAHSTDAFARRYMAWIGHFEFGLNFRPINFSGWLEGGEIDANPPADFWLRYWTAAYQYALDNRTSNVVFVDFDRLLAEQSKYLDAIGRAVEIRSPEALAEQAGRLRAPTTTDRPAAGSADTLQAARAVHAKLRAAGLATLPSAA
jgi:hypothetical protein